MMNAYPIKGDFYLLHHTPKYYDYSTVWNGKEWVYSPQIRIYSREKRLEHIRFKCMNECVEV